MHLVILEEETWSDRIFWIKDVNLKDGALPTICGQSANIIGLEPAVWAKVKVLQLVVINITEKVLHWTTCRPQECTQRKGYHGNDEIKKQCKHTHSVRLDSDEIVRQCDFDELLKITTGALRLSPTSQNLLWEIFRLLHLHVLPLIYFTKDEDEAEVDRALENQNKVLKEVEQKLDEKSEERRLLQKELCSRRQSICKMLEEDGFNLEEYCNEFITILEGGLSEDLKFAFTEIDNFCCEIEELTQMEKRSNGKTKFDETLARIKKERDEYMVYLSTVLVVREEIENFCRESPSTVEEKEITEIQKEYMEEAAKWKLLSNVAEKLFWTKIHAVSIREALSFQQLEMKFSTDSPRTTTFSIKVMGRDSIPTEWQTIDEQVTKALENNEELVAIHGAGKASIMNLCATSPINTMNNNHQQSQHRRDSSRLQRKGGIRRRESIKKLDLFKENCYEQKVSLFCTSFLMTSPSDMFGALTTKVKTEIKNLFERVTEKFLKDNTFNSNNVQRLWICYEKFVFPDLLFPYIIPMYQRAHQLDLNKLQYVLRTVTLKKLGLENEVQLLKLLGLTFEANGDSNNNNFAKTKGSLNEKNELSTEELSPYVSANLANQKKEKLLSASARRLCFHRQVSVDIVEDSKPLNFVPFRRSVTDETWDFVDDDDIPDVQEIEDESRKVGKKEMDGLEMRPLKVRPGSGSNRTSTRQKVNVHEFQKRFQQVFTYFSQALSDPIPYIKLERLTKCLSKFTYVMSQQASTQNVKFSMSADDLLSSVILLLAYGHPDIVTTMYTHVIFLRDYIPTFMENGKFGYTLISFLGGYGALLEIAESQENKDS